MADRKLDNGDTTAVRKVHLRRRALDTIDYPVIMETCGGYGHLYRECYSGCDSGVVFEKEPHKASILAVQRPTWSVYQADSIAALQAGAGSHLEVNYLDIDPYGNPWPFVEAFFSSDRPRAPRLEVVVNDSLRQKVRYGSAWAVKSLQPMVERFGNDLWDCYIDVARELLEYHAAKAGYRTDKFIGYHCGRMKNQTQYWSSLVLDKATVQALAA